MNLAGQANTNNRGYAMAVLLVGLGVMAILLTAAMPVWRQISQREKEEELVFRGTQYARAIGLYQRKYANTSPPSVDVLIEQRFLRAKFKDPMVPDGEFQLLYQTTQAPGSSGGQGRGAAATPGAGGGRGESVVGRGGIIGVVSKSTQTALKLYNGRTHYNEWQFVYVAQTVQPGAVQGAGTSGPGRGARGQGGSGTGTGATPGQSPPARRGQPGDQPREGGPGGFGGAPPSRSRPF